MVMSWPWRHMAPLWHYMAPMWRYTALMWRCVAPMWRYMALREALGGPGGVRRGSRSG